MIDSATTRKPLPPASAAFLPGRLRAFTLVGLELALIVWVVHCFHIEGTTLFFRVLCLAAGGFLIHAWLPRPWRAAFFALLSLFGILLVLGWPNGAWVIGIGAGLIALCHLPLPLLVRVLLLVLAGVLLAQWRWQFPQPFWPVLASMFMFRLIVYLYEVGSSRRRPPLAHTLAYFFPLPNICFPLFPVLDFEKFRSTYYDDDDYAIYQSGIVAMVRGISHLLLYRVVKYYLLPAPHQLSDLPHLLLFLAANYALYLRVSGWFHIIIGILHLFGFNLPRTHHNYFLASSVSDIWRRINIYWKEFMAKVFFWPVFFRLRRWGTPVAVIGAVLWVFVVTWLLHSYQVFWLRSQLPRSFAILWLSAGIAMVVNVLLELFFKRRVQQKPKQSLAGAAGSGSFSLFHEALAGATLALRIMATFLLVSFFWACWTLPRFHLYLYERATSGMITAAGVGTMLGCVVGGMAAGALMRLAQRGMQMAEATMQNERQEWSALSILHSAFRMGRALLPAGVLLVMVVAAIPQVGVALGPPVAKVLATLRLEAPTPIEAALAVRGYYEELADAPSQADPLLSLPDPAQKKPIPRAYIEITRPSDDFLERELIPSWSGEILGQRFTINSLGMRDREGIAREKPAGVCRLAFIGSSVVMGLGVSDEKPFPRQLEALLNAERSGKRRNIEVLNFGTGKSNGIHRLTLLQRKVLAFEPDAIYYVAHQDEFEGAVYHLAMLVERRNKLPAYLQEIAQEAGVSPGTPLEQGEIRLQRFAPQIVRGVYADIVQQCRQRGTLPVWVYLPMPAGLRDAAFDSLELIELAKQADFVVLNLDRWNVGRAQQALQADRYHPNAAGHQLIAEKLEEALRQRPDALPACARP